jgi:crotonobetainyl-CoA:carnitine CoA-transferase CaiB-like acyl-CoA transferase
MGGVMSLTGQPGGELTRIGSSIGDMTDCMFTAIGINATLFHRQKTGEAQKIDAAMLDSQVVILENAIARYSTSGDVPGRWVHATRRLRPLMPSRWQIAISLSLPETTVCSPSFVKQSVRQNLPKTHCLKPTP